MNKGITKAMMLSNSGKNKGSRAKENNQDYGRDYDRMDRDYGSRDYNRMGRNSSGYDDDRMGGGYGRREYDDHDMSQYGNMGRRYGREAKDYDDYGKESRDRMGRRREAGARYEDDDDEDGGAYRFRMDGKLDMGKVGHVDKLTAPKAEEITRKMVNEDGSKGAHWNMEQTKQVMEQRGIQCDPVEFYVTMNMMYSDYYPVAKKLNVNSVEFYADMAKAFLDDKDAGKDKLEKYFAYVVK